MSPSSSLTQAPRIAPQQRAWLLLAVGDDRQHGGNLGYDDKPASYYTWDSTVQNSESLLPGDIIALWDKEKLLGISVIEQIGQESSTKPRLRCPLPGCGRTNIKRRKRSKPPYRCYICGNAFDQPLVDTIDIVRYRSKHDASWAPLEGLLSGRELCLSPRSQHSMRRLDWTRFRQKLTKRGAEASLKKVEQRSDSMSYNKKTETGRAPNISVSIMPAVPCTQSPADFEHFCALTGPAPIDALQVLQLRS